MSEAISAQPGITVEKNDRAVVARPGMKMMDDDALKALARMVDEAVATPPGVPLVVIDLSQVSILPSLALGLLVQIANKCRSRQQTLKLAALRPQLRQVFAVTRLDRVFQFADSVDAAMM